ncbi:hypothetical protein M422DRAFT_265345, partial [Sphaerobolus stellatus SS14]
MLFPKGFIDGLNTPQLNAIYQEFCDEEMAKLQQFIDSQGTSCSQEASLSLQNTSNTSSNEKNFSSPPPFSTQVPQLVVSTEENSPKDDKSPLTPGVAHAKECYNSNPYLFTTSTYAHTGSASNVLGLQLDGSTDSSQFSTYNNGGDVNWNVKGYNTYDFGLGAIEENSVAVGNDCTSTKIASFDTLLSSSISETIAAPQAPSTGVQQNIDAQRPVAAAYFDLSAFPAATFAAPQAPALAASSTVSQPSPNPAVAPFRRATAPKKRPLPYIVEAWNSPACHVYPTPPTNVLAHAQYPIASGSGRYPPFGRSEGNNPGLSDVNAFTFGAPAPNG